MLDPEVWEHSLDYKPPPASHVTSTSNPVSAPRSFSNAPAPATTPIVSPSLPGGEHGTPVADESVGFVPPPLSRCWAYAPPMPRSAPTVYIRLLPDRRDFYLYTPEEVEDDTFRTDYLSAKDLPASITEVRLLDFQRLEERAEQLERDFDEARSYLDDAPPPDYFDRSCLSAKERSRYRRALTGRYEAAIAESDNVYDTIGKAAADAKKTYEAAKEALLNDLFGPAPAKKA